MAEIIRCADPDSSPKDSALETLALAVMGTGELAGDAFAENAVWEGAGGVLCGRAAILASVAAAAPADGVRVEQVVGEGRAGAVSGRITRGAQTNLFCHLFRFSSAARQEVAHVVSFEHCGGRDAR